MPPRPEYATTIYGPVNVTAAIKQALNNYHTITNTYTTGETTRYNNNIYDGSATITASPSMFPFYIKANFSESELKDIEVSEDDVISMLQDG